MKYNPVCRSVIYALSCCLLVAVVGCGSGVSSNVFTNPLLRNGADPWVIASNGWYYYMDTTGANLTLRKTQDLSDLQHAETKVAWTPEPGKPWSSDIWAPELHRWGNKWYIYFAADDGNNADHRIYVVENTSDDPMDGQWLFKGKVSDSTDRWAIDPDLVEVNGAHYLLWSGWKGDRDGEQDIFIAQMSDPWTISSPRTMISAPTYSWETVGEVFGNHIYVNEGPEALVHEGQIFVTYSASGCWTDAYALGLLHATRGADLLDAATWSKSDHAVFAGDSTNKVFGPGHNGFFQSPDGTESWLIYHANGAPGQGCGSTRSPRMQPFTWGSDQVPNFGIPVAAETFLRKPSQ